ncbi:NUDIX domain-containing protein [Candidatus Babeliales bacterium]|nr:NUDIX domain-containing protein [Candidatus Babeliales bacterium]MBP9844364.1 NUDIX domain-containing protein [Candidatus Babeliales bacterium]
MSNTVNIINKFHLGVYAIILKERSIVFIKKSRGPYTGKLDLPGGKPEHGETPEQTLAREVDEETGIKVLTEKLFDNYSTVAQEKINESEQENIHHMGMIYLVSSYDDSALTEEMNSEDSLGAQWYPLDSLTPDKLSPFAYKVIVDIKSSLLTK